MGLEKDGLSLIVWFDSSQTFQAVAAGFKSFEHVKHFTLVVVDIPCKENLKLQGVEVDSVLNFDKQIKKGMCIEGFSSLMFYRGSASSCLWMFKPFIQIIQSQTTALLYGISVSRQTQIN